MTRVEYVMEILEEEYQAGNLSLAESTRLMVRVKQLAGDYSRWYQNEKGEVRCDDCDWMAATGGPEALAEAVEEHRYCGGCGARMVGEITTEVVMW